MKIIRRVAAVGKTYIAQPIVRFWKALIGCPMNQDQDHDSKSPRDQSTEKATYERYAHLRDRLGGEVERIRTLGWPNERVTESYGWIARELISPVMFTASEFQRIDYMLSMLPETFGAARLLSADSVDSSLAEALALTGIFLRHGKNAGYESMTTAKGKNPDAVVREDKLVYEIRFIDTWEPEKDRNKIRDAVYRELRTKRTPGKVVLKFSHPISFKDTWKPCVNGIVEMIEGMLASDAKSGRFPLDCAENAVDRPSIDIRIAPGDKLEVTAKAPNVFAVSGKTASAHAKEHNESVGAISVHIEGVTVVDHVRAKAKKKIVQLEKDWHGIVILVSRIDFEPHITWEFVLPQLLGGDELIGFSLGAGNSYDVLRFPDTGLTSKGANSRLLGVIGCTIDYRGNIVEICAARNDLHAEVPASVRSLLEIDDSHYKHKPLYEAIAGVDA